MVYEVSRHSYNIMNIGAKDNPLRRYSFLICYEDTTVIVALHHATCDLFVFCGHLFYLTEEVAGKNKIVKLLVS